MPHLRRERAQRAGRSGGRPSGTDLGIGPAVPALGRWAAGTAAAAFLVFLSPAAAEVTVFAAASLTAAASEVFEGEGSTEVSLSFAASSVLAHQIDAGAPADLFLSANSAWMDFLEQRGRIDTATRVDLLANRLAVVAPAGSGLDVEMAGDFDFPDSFAGRLALGDPDHVPAGVYAKQALVRLGWWSRLEPRLAPAPDVRGALVFVERGACSAGIVYATDAAASDRIEVAAEIPDSLHEPILYPAAVVAGRDSPQVRAAMARLLSPAAARIFRRHDFVVLPRPRRVTTLPE